MIDIIAIGVAAWMVYEAIRAVTPVPAALNSFLVAGICYGLLFVPPVVLTVLHAVAVVALIRTVLAFVERPQYAMNPQVKRMPKDQKPSRIHPLP